MCVSSQVQMFDEISTGLDGTHKIYISGCLVIPCEI